MSAGDGWAVGILGAGFALESLVAGCVFLVIGAGARPAPARR
ncbi:hypothetical protein [Streptomyces sp. NPDC054783]